jgi:hypothetical protein
MPSLVYPDTWQARTDAKINDPQEDCTKFFCSEFKIDHHPLPHETAMKVVCANRDPGGDRAHNLCLRCMVGYPMLSKQEAESIWGKDATATRSAGLRLS